MPKSTVPNLLQEARHALAMQQAAVSRVVGDADLAVEPDRVHASLSMLLQYYVDRGHAVLALLASRLDWDAEILLRTCYECASKTLFIALSPRSERRQLVWGFWVPLGEAADRKAARKAGVARDVFRLLHDPRMVRDRMGLSKKARRHLEQK